VGSQSLSGDVLSQKGSTEEGNAIYSVRTGSSLRYEECAGSPPHPFSDLLSLSLCPKSLTSADCPTWGLFSSGFFPVGSIPREERVQSLYYSCSLSLAPWFDKVAFFLKASSLVPLVLKGNSFWLLLVPGYSNIS
jgi:hypothetical protein